MKGIVLAGGTGSRLWPITKSVSKQLLPVYDKPMIYYPISTLMLAGVKDILIITTMEDQKSFQSLLGDGSDFGVNFTYAIQLQPKGLADALIIGEKHLSGDSCLMILGDNIFHGDLLGHELSELLPSKGSHIFTYKVSDPSSYGVLKVDSKLNPIAITEKPKEFVSNLAVTGLYFFDHNASRYAKEVTPSARGELEITSVIERYIQDRSLSFTSLGRGTAWLDTGTPNSLHDAATYVRVMEERTGLKIGCPEEVAWQNGWLSNERIKQILNDPKKGEYSRYLEQVIQGTSKNKVNIFRHESYKFSKLELKTNTFDSDISVAVVMPIFNPDREFLWEALRSICEQTIVPEEMILVFDGWRDESLEIDIACKYPNTIFLFLDQNQGQGSARNFGAIHARSTYLAFLDQDDRWLPTHIETLLDGFKAGKFICGYSDLSEIDSVGNITIDSIMQICFDLGGINPIKSTIEDLLFRDLMIFPSASMVNRESFLASGGFLKNMRGHEDDYLFRRLLQNKAPHFYTGLKTSNWRKHSGGTSSSLTMSHSRLVYGQLLLEEFNSDAILQSGISIRILNSFIRELLVFDKSEDREKCKVSFTNSLVFYKCARNTGAKLPLKYKLYFASRSTYFNILLIKIFKKINRVLM